MAHVSSALSLAPPAALRQRCLAALSLHLPKADALDAEHACYCAAAANGASYRRLVLTALHGLEHGALAGLVATSGGAAALAAPPEIVYGRWPAREAAAAVEAAAERGRAVLRDLAQGDAEEDAPDAGVRCQRCGSSEITVGLLQTRSADEGTTIYCTCAGCGKRWKM